MFRPLMQHLQASLKAFVVSRRKYICTSITSLLTTITTNYLNLHHLLISCSHKMNSNITLGLRDKPANARLGTCDWTYECL
jgi:hypothetical protein